jgi:hypothetical protein
LNGSKTGPFDNRTRIESDKTGLYWKPLTDLNDSLIQGSGSLRPVIEEKKAKPASDTRGVLLDQIRSGVTLKKVDPEALSRGGDEDLSISAGIAGMLQKALQERSAALCLSSSEDDEPEDDEDEWDE